MATGDGALYLLHFEPAYGHARHYLGFVLGDESEIERRLAEHLAGRGSPLVKAAVAAGCTVQIARRWFPSDRTTERQLKNRKMAPRMCPVCRERKQEEAASC